MGKEHKEIQYIPIECIPIEREEDTIDLKELLNTLKKNKRFIIIFTFLATLLVGIYLYFFAKPVYESKTLIEIGHYKNKLLEKSTTLATKLENIFIEPQKYKKNQQAWVKNISPIKKSDKFLTINTYGYTQKLSKEKLQELINYIQTTHQEKLTSIKKLLLRRIEIIKQEIKKLQSFDLAQIDLIIQKNKETINKYKKTLKELSHRLEAIEKSNSTLALLGLLQQQSIQSQIQSLENRIESLTKRKIDIKLQINKLQEKIEDIKDSLSPVNYSNSHPVGNILTPQNPIKPRKLLILAITLISSLLFSIFILFFREWLKK